MTPAAARRREVVRVLVLAALILVALAAARPVLWVAWAALG